jgi:hypothetical protein
MSDILNEINMELYKNHFEKKCEHRIRNSKKDTKFYKKRILNLTRELFISKDACVPDVNYAFANYISQCVEYFKNIDTTDILQEEYNQFELESYDFDVDEEYDAINNVNDNESYFSSMNSEIMRKINVKTNTLDNFIIRNVIKKHEPDFLPIQKEINLKDPSLRVKGISKKKNLNNTYEETPIEENKEETF